MTAILKKALLPLLVLSWCASAQAHTGSINLFVSPENDQIYPLETFEIAQLRKFLPGTPSEEISVDGPGFTVSFPTNGVDPDSTLNLSIEQDLIYWDGNGIATPTVSFLLNVAPFDNQGVFNQSPVTVYDINATSGKLTGMEWGTYNGLNFWEAHGINFLSPTGDAPAGIYSVSARISTDNHLDSDVFAIPFVYDPNEQWDTAAEAVGVERVREATAAFDLADLNDDGHVDTADVDALVAEIAAGSSNLIFDLTGDGAITDKDLNEWRLVAGRAKLPQGNPFLRGDANLDGVVDVSDFNLWNSNKFTNVAAWSQGDFDANGAVDVSDFNLWNANKFTSAADTVFPASVPEPAGYAIALMAFLFPCRIWRRKLD